MTAPTLPGKAPAFPPSAPAAPATGTAAVLRDIFQLDDYLRDVANDKQLEGQKKLAAAYDRAVQELVGPNDQQMEMVWDREAGEKVPRYFKKKSAWKKLARHFRIDVAIGEHRVFINDAGELVAEVIAHGSAPWGQSAEALGACTTHEKRFAKDKSKAWHDCLATAQTRASNRVISDLIAAGEVSAEEMTPEAEQQQAAAAPQQSPEEIAAARKQQLASMTLDHARTVPLRGAPDKWQGNGSKPLGDVPYGVIKWAYGFLKERSEAAPEDAPLAYQVRALELVEADMREHEDAKKAAKDADKAAADAAEKEARDGPDMFKQTEAPMPPASATTAPMTKAEWRPSTIPDGQPEDRREWSDERLRAHAIHLLEHPGMETIAHDARMRLTALDHDQLAKSVTMYEGMVADEFRVAEIARERARKAGRVGDLPGDPA